jgi:hypothetical protein
MKKNSNSNAPQHQKDFAFLVFSIRLAAFAFNSTPVGIVRVFHAILKVLASFIGDMDFCKITAFLNTIDEPSLVQVKEPFFLPS